MGKDKRLYITKEMTDMQMANARISGDISMGRRALKTPIHRRDKYQHEAVKTLLFIGSNAEPNNTKFKANEAMYARKAKNSLIKKGKK
tara:strand:- start:55 stop:318 length:264 start_codon:yes stop_codon:yes gene_type:complete